MRSPFARSPKKKAKQATKSTADEDSDLDAPLMPPKADPYLEKLKGHVQSVIKEQDMDSLTLRMVCAECVCWRFVCGGLGREVSC